MVCVIRTPPYPLAPPPRPSLEGLKSRRTRTAHPPLQPEGGRKSEGYSNGSLQKNARYATSRRGSTRGHSMLSRRLVQSRYSPSTLLVRSRYGLVTCGQKAAPTLKRARCANAIALLARDLTVVAPLYRSTLAFWARRRTICAWPGESTRKAAAKGRRGRRLQPRRPTREAGRRGQARRSFQFRHGQRERPHKGAASPCTTSTSVIPLYHPLPYLFLLLPILLHFPPLPGKSGLRAY